MAEIFLSYASQDRERIRPLVEALEADGFTLWWDRNIQPGPSFDREIEEAIASSSCVLVAWSTHSVNSEWVRSEVDEGARRGILIPVLIDEVLPPLAYRRRQAADLSDWDGQPDEEYEQLVTALRRTLSDGDAVLDASGGDAADSPRRRRRGRRFEARTLGLACVLTLGLGIAGTHWMHLRTADAIGDAGARVPVLRARTPFPAGMEFQDYNFMAFSPDGSRLVAIETAVANLQLWQRPLDALDWERVAEVPAVGVVPGLSDDAIFAFTTGGASGRSVRLEEVELTSGAHRVVLPEVPSTSLGWASTPSGMLANATLTGIRLFDPSTGTQEQVTTPVAGFQHLHPEFADAGRKLLYVEREAADPDATQVVRLRDLETGEDRLLFSGGQPRLAGSGHLLFVRDNQLWATAFDAARGEAHGASAAFFGISFATRVASWPYAVSSTGTLAFVPRSDAEQSAGAARGRSRPPAGSRNLPRRTLAGLHLQRDRTKRGLRSPLSERRRGTLAGVRQRRLPARLESQ